MKIVKLNKKLLSMHPSDLLVKLGAVDTKKTLALPQHVYFSKVDYKKLESNLKKYVKKNSAGYSIKMIDFSVGVEMLNYGPNQTLENVLKPGFALVDEDEIGRSKE